MKIIKDTKGDAILGAWEFRRVDTTTLKGLKKAEKLVEAGWTVQTSSIFSVVLQRKVKLEDPSQ